MSKILITDFCGTLISGDPSRMEYFYSTGNHLRDILELYNDKEYYNNLINRAFIRLGRLLNEFLSDGNYLKLVTSMDSHDSISFIFTELLSRLYDSVKEYKDQVSVFITGGSGNKADSEYNRKIGFPYFVNHKVIESKRVKDLSMYPTFSDYCDKVLRK